MKTLDVLIPYYNKKDYIQTAIDSIFKCPNYNKYLNRIIIVNDGSDRENTKFLSELQKTSPYIQVVNRKKNKGLFATRLEAFKTSNADYVVSLDADDTFSEDAFNIFNDFIEQDKDVVLLYEMVSSYNGLIDDDRETDQLDQWSFEEMIDSNLHFDNSMCIKLLTRRIKDKLVALIEGCFIPSDIKLNFMEDVLFTGVLITVEPCFASVDRIAYVYNRNCDSIMSGVRDISPFEIYYKYIKPTGKLSSYSIKYLEHQLKEARGD